MPGKRKRTGNPKSDDDYDDGKKVEQGDMIELGSSGSNGNEPNNGTTSSPMIPEGLLPSYLSEAFADLYGEDGLVVMGKGLGWLSLLATFVRYYSDVDEGYAAVVAGSTGKFTATGTGATGADATSSPVTKSQLCDLFEMKNMGMLDFSHRQRDSLCDYFNLLYWSEVKVRKKAPLVMVIGLKENEQRSLISILESWGTPMEFLPRIINNESGPNKDRAVMYKLGGVFCITKRILIVDLLSNVADPKDIDGFLVAHADRVTEDSTEAFILRIFHSQKLSSVVDNNGNSNSNNKSGFVKAFTDSPESLLSSFAKIDKILKALRVRRLFLYPRFHNSIRNELEMSPPHVDELRLELSPNMKEIQNAIAAAVQGCIRELKKSTTLLEWTDADLSVENCVTNNFHMAIQKQLENDWHRLKPQTKALVEDLRTLRKLFLRLIENDCVNFWRLINSIKSLSAASRYPSMWLLMPAADMLFRKAKDRVYKIIPGNPTVKIPKPVSKLKPMLEETPKWKLLKQVLEEIREEHIKKREKRRKKKQKNLTMKGQDVASEADERGDDYDNREPVIVLVMIKDELHLNSIRSYLVDGKGRTMMVSWLRYLEQFNARSRSLTDSKGGTSAISEESRILLEEEGRVRCFLFGNKKKGSGRSARSNNANVPATTAGTDDSTTASHNKRKQLNEVPDYIRKHRRIAREKGRGGLTTGKIEDLQRQAVLDEAVERTEHDLDGSSNVEGANSCGDSVLPSLDAEDRMFEVKPFQSEMRVILKSYSSLDGENALLMLQDLRPRYIVLYDAEVAFIRSVETYAALSATGDPGKDPVRVFFLIFEASAEEKTFMTALEKEQSAFERLIHHKKTMPPPAMQNLESQEVQQAQALGKTSGSYMGGSLPIAFDTRRGRGKAKANGEMRDIAVDVREFRSPLPAILHQGGMRIAPVTLTVGDFVLSSVHCVERKSISDLYGSFASGRLYEQAAAMCKHYKCPCLLIEFDANKSFCLQNSNDLGVEIRSDSICSKMVLLTLHHPQLRILWSRKPHHTVRIFKELKANHDEVNVEKAIEVGRSESIDAIWEATNEDEDEVNEVARDMLLRLPGVTAKSARKIRKECDSLAELCEMSREELRKIAGPSTGQKLFTFFRQKMAAT